MQRVKILFPVFILSLFIFSGCQFLGLDSSQGAFPIDKGTQWVYVDSATGDTVTLTVGRKVIRTVGPIYCCDSNKLYGNNRYFYPKVKGREVKFSNGDLIPFRFDFIVQNGDCYNFYDTAYGSLVVFGRMNYNEFERTYEMRIYNNRMCVPPSVYFTVRYKPFVGFKRIVVMVNGHTKVFDLVNYKIK